MYRILWQTEWPSYTGSYTAVSTSYFHFFQMLSLTLIFSRTMTPSAMVIGPITLVGGPPSPSVLRRSFSLGLRFPVTHRAHAPLSKSALVHMQRWYLPHKLAESSYTQPAPYRRTCRLSPHRTGAGPRSGREGLVLSDIERASV